MGCRRRPEVAACRRSAARRPSRAHHALLAMAAALLAISPLPCEERVLVGGLFDAEIWKTVDGSTLLTRDGGKTAPAGRLRLWSAGQFGRGLQGFVLGAIEGGAGTEEGKTDATAEQAFLRYSFTPAERVILQAGRFVSPIGNFARRYLSSANPLVGSPGGYDPSYPVGVQVGGKAALFDYRVAIVDRPLVSGTYLPQPGTAARPALALGVTPVVGARLGVYATRGPYLSRDLEAMLPAGAGWKDFAQEVYGLDAQFSRGYFELNGDVARTAYEVPGIARDVRGGAYFVEPKYTFTPRLFAALRFERNQEAYIKPLAPGVWIGAAIAYSDIEAGAGYRLGPGTILKLAYRKDRWSVKDSLRPFYPDGYSLSMQLSHTFDANSWFERPR